MCDRGVPRTGRPLVPACGLRPMVIKRSTFSRFMTIPEIIRVAVMVYVRSRSGCGAVEDLPHELRAWSSQDERHQKTLPGKHVWSKR